MKRFDLVYQLPVIFAFAVHSCPSVASAMMSLSNMQNLPPLLEE